MHPRPHPRPHSHHHLPPSSSSSYNSGGGYGPSVADSGFGSGGGGGSDNRSAMDASFDNRSQSTARRFEILFNSAQEKIGRDAIGEILSAAPAEDADDNPALLLQIRSYREAMLSIMAQLLNRDKVREDFAEIIRIENQVNVIAPVQIADDIVEKVVDLMKAANQIADKYKKTPTDFGEIRTKMTQANPAKRREFLNYYFESVFTPPVAEEFDRAQKIEHVAMSLTCTNAFEALTKTLVEAGVFSAKDCGKIGGYLAFARDKLLRANKDVDAETLSKSRPLYEHQLKEATTYAGNVCGTIPLTLTLFKHPPAILMLKNEKGAYSDFGRIELDLQYLSTDQKKALFVLLYEVSSHFKEFSTWYTSQTFKKSAVQEKDIVGLIAVLRDQIKTPSQPQDFKPGNTDKGKLLAFSATMEDLVSGETFKTLVIWNFDSLRRTLGNSLNGITHDGIRISGQSPLMHEVLDLVTAPGSNFRTPATAAEYDDMSILVQKMSSIETVLQDEALKRRLLTASKSGSSIASASPSPSHSITPSASTNSLASMPSSGSLASLAPPSSTSSRASSPSPSVSSKPVTRTFGGGQLAAFGTMASRKNLNFASVAEAQVALDQYKQKLAAQRSTLHPDIVKAMEEDIQKVDAAIAADKLLLATPLLEKIAGILEPDVAPKLVISKKAPSLSLAPPPSLSSSVAGAPNAPIAPSLIPPLGTPASSGAMPPPAAGSSSSSSPSPAGGLSPQQQKAAAAAAAQIQEITALEATLATKKGKIAAVDYDELEKNLAAVKALNQAGGAQAAFASIKLRPIRQAIQALP